MERRTTWRFSVRLMLIAIAAISLAFAAILNANQWWGAVTSIANTLLFAVALAGCFSPRHRFFCLGVIGVAIMIGLAWLQINIPSALPFYDNLRNFANREYYQEMVVTNVSLFVVAVVAGTISQVLFGKRES